MKYNAIVDADTRTRRLLELMQAILSAADAAELVLNWVCAAGRTGILILP